MNIKKLFLLIILMHLLSCKPESANKTVVIGTEGIFDGVLIEVIGGEDRGEVLVGSEPVYVDIKIENLSKYSITDISLDFETSENSAEMEWAYIDSGDPIYPGDNGKGCIEDELSDNLLCPCPSSQIISSASLITSEVNPSKCYLSIIYNPEKTGEYTQPFKVSYRNLVEYTEERRVLAFKTGHAASLVVVDDESFFDFGNVEQTSITPKVRKILVENRGGLTATDIHFVIESDINPPPVVVEEHDCPLFLGYLDSCNITVSYTALNNRVIDEEELFTSTFKMNYIDDARERVGSLNLFYEFFSTKIKANFISQKKIIDFPNLVAGTFSEKEIVINNDGLRKGIIDQVIIYNENDKPVMYCNSEDNESKLFCFLDNDMMARLIDVPFEVYDLNQCLGREIKGVTVDSSGESCFLKLRFHPSINIDSQINVSDWSFGLSYFSNWHDDPTFKEIAKIFKINANATKRAKLSISVYNITNQEYKLKRVNDDINTFDFGGVKLIQPGSNLEQTKIEVRLKNTGQGEITIQGTMDGQSKPVSISKESKTLTSVLYPEETSYYKNIANGCEVGIILAEGDTCKLTFDIVPVFFNDTFKEESMLFDYGAENLGFNINKYKEFNFYFKDNSTYNDDYTLTEQLHKSVKLTGELKYRGILVFDADSLNHNVGTLQVGESAIHSLRINNVGTGPVEYIKFEDNFDPFKKINDVTNPFFIIPDFNISEGDKDCYYIVDFSENVSLDEDYDAKGILNPGESCQLMVFVRVRDDTIQPESYFDNLDKELLREYSKEIDSRPEVWEFRQDIDTSLELSFLYRDGDKYLYNQENESYNFHWGNEVQVTLDEAQAKNNHYKIEFEPFFAGKWLPSTPLPSTSAVLYRPFITYPFMSFASFISFDSYIADDLWILLKEGESAELNNQEKSIEYVEGIINEYPGEYLFHAGTFPADQSHNFSFVMSQYEGKAEIIDFEFNNLSGSNAIQLVNLTKDIIGRKTGEIKLEFIFSPVDQVKYESEVLITYYNGLKDKDGNAIEVRKVIKVIAEGITNFPELEISYQLYDINYNNSSNEVVESLIPGVFTIPTVYNRAHLDEITLSEIRDSKSYGKVTIKLKNISNLPFEGIDLRPGKEFNSAEKGNFEEIDYKILDSNKDKDLAPGEEIEFDIVYNPITTSLISSLFITLNYNIASNQSISTGFNINLLPLNPAVLTTEDLPTFYVIDAESGISLPSFEHNFGSVNNPSHIILSGNYPQVESSGDILITNITNMNASFLKALEEVSVSINNINNQFKIIDSLGNERVISVPFNSVEVLSEFKKYTHKELAEVIEGLLNVNQINNQYSVSFDHMEGKYNISSNSNFRIEWVGSTGEKSSLWELMGFNDDSILLDKNVFQSDINLLSCDYEGKDYKIYEKDINDTQLTICATKPCIVGDDQKELEFYKRGFNSASTEQCQIEIFLSLNEKYISKSIAPSEHLINLNYYNNNRETTGFITFNLNGFVEANKSIPLTNNGIYNVQSESDGSVNFSWDHAEPESVFWGNGVGYRIFISPSRSRLESIAGGITSDLLYLDVDRYSNNVHIENLTPSRYYYFKVVLMREKNNIIYASEITGRDIIDVVIPPSGSIYIHDYRSLVETKKPDEIGLKQNGIDYCRGKSLGIVDDGVQSLYKGGLINKNIWDYLKRDPDPKNYSNYSEYNLVVISHWLGDDPVDISSYFEEYGFDSGNMGQYVPEEQLIYQKNCTNSSCNELSMVAGGDGIDLPLDALFFVDEEKIHASFRCYFQLQHE